MNAQLKQASSSIRSVYEQQLLPRYQELQQRERYFLLVAAILLPLVMLVFAIMMPMQDRQNLLRHQLQQAEQQVTEAERLALLLQQQGNQGAGMQSADPMTTVERLAGQTGIRSYMTRIRPQASPGGGAQQLMMQLKNAPFDKTLQFMHALSKQGLGLSSMKVQTGNGPGLVQVRAVISSN